MRVHHLSCGTLNPIYPPIKGICYCMLVQTEAGLVLVDTGFGTADYQNPTPAVSFFMAANRMPRDLGQTALHQIVRLGYSPEDVRHIVMTHLHIDHAGGLPDFPNARVHVHAREHAAAMRASGPLGRLEYISRHWRHGPRWDLHSAISGRWFGFECIRILADLPAELLLIPLPGHTPGHCGVAVKLGERWLFLLGDEAYPFYSPRWMRTYGRPPAWVLRVAGVGRHLPRLQALWREHGDDIDIIFSHDHMKWAELQARAVEDSSF